MGDNTDRTPLAEQEPPAIKKGWRFYTGVVVLILSLVLPLFAFLVPLLGLSTGLSAVVIGLLVAGGPEVLGLLAVALLGKDIFQYLRYKAKRAFGNLFTERVSKERYYFGLTINLISWVPLYLYGYLPTYLPSDNTRIYILIAGDLSFIFSMFIMGGEFWEKFRQIFIWEGKSQQASN